MKKFFLALFLTLAVLVLALTAQAAGLSTGFSEVILENLEIGSSYSTASAANLPLAVVNTGEEPVNLKIELLKPAPAELKEGFEPIPDLNWIELKQKEFFNLEPKQTAVTDVIIHIPNEQQYKGKKYQVYIWSHTVSTNIGVGLKSKLLFSIKRE
jgi:hypothetical protein